MKYKLVLCSILLLLLITSCVPQGGVSAPTPIPTLIIAQKPVYTVERGEVIKELELRGRVSAIKQEELFFSTNGIVNEILVSRGDLVKAGQVIASLTERVALEVALADAKLDLIKAQKTLDALSEEADLHSAEALVEMLKAQSEMEKAKNERLSLDKPRANSIMIEEAESHFALMDSLLEEARKAWDSVKNLDVNDMERAQALVNLSNAKRARDQALLNLNWYLGHSTEQQIAEADAKLALAEAKYQDALKKYELIKDGPDPYDVALAEATLARSNLNLEKAQGSVDGLTITAPFDGQILSMSITPGTQVSAFKPVITIVDPGGLEVTLLPTTAELAEISVGQSVLVRLPNRPGQEYNGLVRFLPQTTSNSTDQESERSVRISLEDDVSLLALGEAVTVIIKIEKREGVLWISPAALRVFQGRDFVIIQDNEIQRRVDVRLGLKSQDRIEVLEGLSEGQVVLGP